MALTMIVNRVKRYLAIHSCYSSLMVSFIIVIIVIIIVVVVVVVVVLLYITVFIL